MLLSPESVMHQIMPQILSQKGRPVAFISRTLFDCKTRYSDDEKEATSAIEAVRQIDCVDNQNVMMIVIRITFDVVHFDFAYLIYMLKNDSVSLWEENCNNYLALLGIDFENRIEVTCY